MITRSDLVLLLTDLQEKGIDVTEDISKLYQSSNIPVDVLKKILKNLKMTKTVQQATYKRGT